VNTFLAAIAIVTLAIAAIGIVRVFRGPTPADRMMGAQLLGSATIGAAVVVATAAEASAALDVALTLAVLAPFATVGFVRYGPATPPDAPSPRPRR
jgi:multicomponent Na+:H+ antiporter subunit F